MKQNKAFIYFICCVSAMGGLLFGYDWVVIGGAKPFYELYFGIAYCPVYLQILPQPHLYNISIDARADFSIAVNYQVANAPKGYRVEQEVMGEKRLWTA